jgi:aspartate ammonia-lyase
VHPNDHVNMAQSTNDTIPTNIRLAVLGSCRRCEAAVDGLRARLAAKGAEFDDVVKAGRTHLQDAMPIRLGQEFAAYAGTLRRALRACARPPTICATSASAAVAVGTGVTVEPAVSRAHGAASARRSAGSTLRVGADRIQLMQSMGDAAAFSARCAAGLDSQQDRQRPAPDGDGAAHRPRRDRAAGRAAGLVASCPARSIRRSPEMVNQVCFQVIGNDTTVAIAAEHGQLELNVMMPVIAHNVLLSMQLLTNAAARSTSGACGHRGQRAMCAYWVERSAALATALMPPSATAGRRAQQAVGEGGRV